MIDSFLHNLCVLPLYSLVFYSKIGTKNYKVFIDLIFRLVEEITICLRMCFVDLLLFILALANQLKNLLTHGRSGRATPETPCINQQKILMHHNNAVAVYEYRSLIYSASAIASNLNYFVVPVAFREVFVPQVEFIG